jgi:hypothetical protein
MIAKTYILQDLNQLDSAFRNAKTQKHGIYFSKLAILELCGWIEISMDEVITMHCNRHVAERKNTNYVSDVVKKTYGFDYELNFRKMLINLIGIVTCEKIEAQIPVAVHTRFLAQLKSLKIVRNSLAHTYLKGPARTIWIDAPSVTMARFNEIYYGLKEFEQKLRLIKKA